MFQNPVSVSGSKNCGPLALLVRRGLVQAD